MIQKFLSSAIYAKHGDPKLPRGSVGITFCPTPDLSYSDLLELIRELSVIEREMRKSK